MVRNALSRRKSWVARIAVLAVIAGMLVIPGVASAAINTSTSCPSTLPNAPFTDLAGLDATTVDAIDCLVAYGISQGTSATTFNPTGTVARWQMALFLTRQAVKHGVALPSGASQGFTDIGTLDAATQTAINQLKQLGVTSGTSATTFDPFGFVPRWQMALFLTRLAAGAGVTLPSGASQGFTDIGTLDAATQTAINQAKQLGIADGTSTITFDPLSNTLRWQMALFLTRLLAADGITPAGGQVTVTPADTANLAVGLARTYVATFKNADGTAYTGVVGIQVLDVSGVAAVYNDPAEFVDITATTDLVVNAALDEANGVAGTDGVVTFTIKATAAEKAIPIAWIDSDADNGYESTGNNTPGDPFGLGGLSDFTAAAVGEATTATHTSFVVTKTTKASDVFEAALAATNCGNGAGNACSFFYDSGDIYTVDGGAATLADFESVLSVGDVVTAVYDADAPDQSTFSLTDNIAALTVTDPDAAKSVDAATYAIKGTSDPDATIRVKADLNNNGVVDAGEATVATGTADADGKWTVTTPLQQNTANNFLVTQQPVGGVQSAVVDVFTITEGPNVAAKITSSVGANVAPSAVGTLSPSDTVTIVFNEKVAGVGSGDTIGIIDSDGSTATLTCGPDVTCSLDAAGTTLTLTVNTVVFTTGGTAGIQSPAQIQSISGFQGDDGLAIDVAGSGSGRVFTGF